MNNVHGDVARRRRPYAPAVGPRLRVLLVAVLATLAALGANSAYLASVTAAEWFTGDTWQGWLYQWMFLGHLVIGLLFAIPFLLFAVLHLLATRHRRNRRAVRVGYVLLAVAIAVLGSGGLLVGMRVTNAAAGVPGMTRLVYWVHVLGPLVACWLYWLHRLAGPPIRWGVGLSWAGIVVTAIAGLLVLHAQDPRRLHRQGSDEGARYFEPSLARTATGEFIPAKTLMMDDDCRRCHADAHARWEGSAHHFSSFNNPLYLASVRETRRVALGRDGDVRAARWCAGCHDPVPFFSGAFDHPEFDDVHDPTAHAGITCTSCHAITHVNSTRGNADYTIDEPLLYPFATARHAGLTWIHDQLVKAKPALHKKTFLKEFHHDAEFCSTCHKVSIPGELNHYKEFLRGQNHYDSFLLSGVSGHGARSFYYPEKARANCNDCHMPLREAADFGAAIRDDTGRLTVHDHLFPGANTGLAALLGRPDVIEAHQGFLEDAVRVDLFGLRKGMAIDGPLTAPLWSGQPGLQAGRSYVLETVIRTLALGHLFTQGTVDSNEVWLDISVESEGRVIGRSGALDPAAGNSVDPAAHFVNVFMLDRDGNRIDRRNVQDIFVPLYDHQIPPGAAWTVHYGLELPADAVAPVTIRAKLQYRKFDTAFLTFVAEQARPGDPPTKGITPGRPAFNELPITTLAEAEVTLLIEDPSVEKADAAEPVMVEQVHDEPSHVATWERWNDYGIGLLVKGKGELRQAEEAFLEVERLGRFDGPLNLARVYLAEGRIDEAAAALERAAAHTAPAPPAWTLAWLAGQVSRQQGNLEEAEANFRKVLEDHTPEMRARGFDFSRDYEVRNLLALTLFDRASRLRGSLAASDRRRILGEAAAEFEKTLAIDAENIVAHYNLARIHDELGDREVAERHRQLHARYKRDDNAADRAVRLAREKYPAADRAAEAVAIYPLHE
ncbi:MAG: multiheme c-type cytochrome [Planctomycetota bacterium]|nr:multiheme c-type cytochrome [Planctomycetota bacterium]